MSDLKGQAARGALATGVAQAVRVAIQLASVVLLARLLAPSDFGVFGMVAPIYGFVMMFQDLGLTQATIQKSDITPQQLSALFWINFGVSVALGLGLMLSSPLVAWFYGEPRTIAIVIAFGVMMIVAGLGSQHMALLNRNMRFGLLSLIDGLGATAGLAASLIVAVFSPTYWALVAGSLAMTLTPTLMAWINLRWMPGRPAKTPGMESILQFGTGITGFNLSNFFARNLDNILIGRVSGETALGLYDRAYKLLLYPLQQVTGPIGRVMLPVLSRLNQDPERYRRAYLNVLSQMLLLMVPGVAWMIISSDLLVQALLGAKWQAAAPIFGALGFAALVQPINSSTGWLYISQGRAQGYMKWGLLFSAISVTSFLIGLPWGALGVATAYAIGEFLKTPIIWWAVSRQGPVAFADFWRVSGAHLLGGATSMAAIGLIRPMLDVGLWIELPVLLAVSYATAWAVVAAFRSGRAVFSESWRVAEGLMHRA